MHTQFDIYPFVYIMDQIVLVPNITKILLAGNNQYIFYAAILQRYSDINLLNEMYM
jgi:hypothetical protein